MSVTERYIASASSWEGSPLKVLRGSLDTFPLDIVLGLLADAAVTGWLELGAGPSRGRLGLTDGRPTAAEHAGLRGEDALEAVLALDERAFTFESGPTGTGDFAMTMDQLRKRARAMRQEALALRREIPSDRHLFVLSDKAASGASFMVTAEHLRILRAIERRQSDIGHISTTAGIDRARVRGLLRELMREEIVEIRPPAAARARAVAHAKAPPSPPKAAAAPAAPAAPKVAPIAESPIVPVEAPSKATAGDDRLAALASAPAAPPPKRPDILIGANEPKPAASVAPIEQSTPSSSEPDEDPSARTSIFVSQYLPAGATMPVVVVEAPAKSRGRGVLDLLAGFGKHRADSAPTTNDALYSPRHQAVLLNALLFGYVGAEARLREAELRELVSRVGTKGLRADPALPISDGRIDAPAVERAGYAPEAVVPVLHAMIRELFDDDARVQGHAHARTVYRAAVGQTLGASDAVYHDALRVVGEGTPLRARLVIERGGSGGPFELEDRAYAIGRSASNDIVLHDPGVSRQHARISPRSGRFVLVDAGSSAGTKVNGEPLKGERALRGGETLQMGEVVLKFERPGSP